VSAVVGRYDSVRGIVTPEKVFCPSKKLFEREISNDFHLEIPASGDPSE
jgi:hypothetical protein